MILPRNPKWLFRSPLWNTPSPPPPVPRLRHEPTLWATSLPSLSIFCCESASTRSHSATARHAQCNSVSKTFVFGMVISAYHLQRPSLCFYKRRVQRLQSITKKTESGVQQCTKKRGRTRPRCVPLKLSHDESISFANVPCPKVPRSATSDPMTTLSRPTYCQQYVKPPWPRASSQKATKSIASARILCEPPVQWPSS